MVNDIIRTWNRHVFTNQFFDYVYTIDCDPRNHYSEFEQMQASNRSYVIRVLFQKKPDVTGGVKLDSIIKNSGKIKYVSILLILRVLSLKICL